MRRTDNLQRLRSDTRGASAVEFALLAPVFIVMLFGVLQVGIGLQNYNAVRTFSAGVARQAMIQYGNGTNNLTLPTQVTTFETFAENAASGPPYMLNGVDVEVTTAATQRVTGARELTLTVTQQIPSVLSSMGLEGPEIEYARPIFVGN